MTSLDIAVVIVTYKCASLTIDCLQSIERERSTPDMNIRAIVVDGASGDMPAVASAVEARGWSSWVSLVQAPRNGGFGYGNNLGAQKAYEDGPPDYIHFLNPDTIVRKGGICELARFLETHKDVGIAGGSFENADGSDWSYAFRFPSMASELVPVAGVLQRWNVIVPMSNEPQPVEWAGGASIMVRREVLDAIGGFDQKFFLYFEETDLCLRARQAGFSTWYVPASRIMHLGQQSTKAARPEDAPKRRSAFWFESRRHYFAANHGLPYAMAADALALLAYSIAYLKLIVRRRSDLWTPHYLTDLLRHSAFWANNRAGAGVREIPHFKRRDTLATQTTAVSVASTRMAQAGTIRQSLSS
jgi:GT2 family glycosyltransferase